MNRRFRFGLAVLSLLALAGAGLYLGAFVNPKFWAFTLSLRLPRLGGMVLNFPDRLPLIDAPISCELATL